MEGRIKGNQRHEKILEVPETNKRIFDEQQKISEKLKSIMNEMKKRNKNEKTKTTQGNSRDLHARGNV